MVTATAIAKGGLRRLRQVRGYWAVGPRRDEAFLVNLRDPPSSPLEAFDDVLVGGSVDEIFLRGRDTVDVAAGFRRRL